MFIWLAQEKRFILKTWKCKLQLIKNQIYHKVL